MISREVERKPRQAEVPRASRCGRPSRSGVERGAQQAVACWRPVPELRAYRPRLDCGEDWSPERDRRRRSAKRYHCPVSGDAGVPHETIYKSAVAAAAPRGVLAKRAAAAPADAATDACGTSTTPLTGQWYGFADHRRRSRSGERSSPKPRSGRYARSSGTGRQQATSCWARHWTPDRDRRPNRLARGSSACLGFSSTGRLIMATVHARACTRTMADGFPSHRCARA